MKFIPLIVIASILIIIVVFWPKLVPKMLIRITVIAEYMGIFFTVLWTLVFINYFIKSSLLYIVLLWIIDYTVNPPISYINHLIGTSLPTITKDNSIWGAVILLGKSLGITVISYTIKKVSTRKKPLI